MLRIFLQPELFGDAGLEHGLFRPGVDEDRPRDVLDLGHHRVMRAERQKRHRAHLLEPADRPGGGGGAGGDFQADYGKKQFHRFLARKRRRGAKPRMALQADSRLIAAS